MAELLATPALPPERPIGFTHPEAKGRKTRGTVTQQQRGANDTSGTGSALQVIVSSI